MGYRLEVRLVKQQRPTRRSTGRATKAPHAGDLTRCMDTLKHQLRNAGRLAQVTQRVGFALRTVRIDAAASCLLCIAALIFAQRAGAFAGVVDASVRLPVPVAAATQGDPACAVPPVGPGAVLPILGDDPEKLIGRRVVPPAAQLLPSGPAAELARLSGASTGSASCATLCVMGRDAPSLDAEACMRDPADGRQQCRKGIGTFERIGTSAVVAFSRTPAGKGMLVCATGRSVYTDGALDFSLQVRW